MVKRIYQLGNPLNESWPNLNEMFLSDINNLDMCVSNGELQEKELHFLFNVTVMILKIKLFPYTACYYLRSAISAEFLR